MRPPQNSSRDFEFGLELKIQVSLQLSHPQHRCAQTWCEVLREFPLEKVPRCILLRPQSIFAVGIVTRFVLLRPESSSIVDITRRVILGPQSIFDRTRSAFSSVPNAPSISRDASSSGLKAPSATRGPSSSRLTALSTPKRVVIRPQSVFVITRRVRLELRPRRAVEFEITRLVLLGPQAQSVFDITGASSSAFVGSSSAFIEPPHPSKHPFRSRTLGESSTYLFQWILLTHPSILVTFGGSSLALSESSSPRNAPRHSVKIGESSSALMIRESSSPLDASSELGPP